MKRLLVLLLWATAVFGQGGGYGPSFGGSGSSSSSAALAGNGNSFYLQPTCAQPTTGNCYFVNVNTKFITDAGWTTATPSVITCPNSDCNFVAADTGKTCYGINPGGGNGLPVGTFTFTSAQAGTCSIAGGSNVTNTGTFAWGTDDTALINAAYTALLLLPTCGNIELPTGNMMISGSIFTATTPTRCATPFDTTGPGIEITGQGVHSTYLIPRPDFTFSPGTVGIGGGASVLYRDFNILGLGATGANTSGKTGLQLGQASNAYNVGVNAWAAGQPFIAINEGGQENFCMGCFTDASGFIGVGGQQVSHYSMFANEGMQVGNNGAVGTLFDFGGVYSNVGASVAPYLISGIYSGRSTTFLNTNVNNSNAVEIAATTGVFICEDCQITDSTNVASQGIFFQSAGKAILKGNTSVTGGSSGGAIFSVGFGGTASSIYIEPTVKFSPVTFPNWNGTVTGPVVQTGSCTGVATAASTLGLYTLGNTTTPTCTSTTVNQGYITRTVGVNGVLSYLNCSASAGGVNASSGVVTVLKNGGATTLTATFGTGTTAIDNTHSTTYVLGDIISIQFTTQAAETLANVKCSVLTL